MKNADEVFESVLGWLGENYCDFCFFTERDVVWTVQKQLKQQIDVLNLPYRVFNDYAIIPGKNRGLCADLAILDAKDQIEVAIEFKYEPSPKRADMDIPKRKLPVTSWQSVQKDILRIDDFIIQGRARSAYGVLVDEGGRYRKHSAPPGSEWREGVGDMWLLYSCRK